MSTQTDRLRTIISAENLSDRAFAKGVGIPTPSLASALSKDQKISALWAYAIEAKYGYSANWILTGEGSQKEAGDNREQAFSRMIAETLLTLLDEGRIVPFIEHGFVKMLDDRIEQNRLSYFRRVKKNRNLSEKERLRRIAEESEKYFKLKSKQAKLLLDCYDSLDNHEYLVLLFYVFMECIRNQKHDVEFYLINIHKLTFTKRIQPLAKELLKNTKSSVELWCTDE